jgi:hypothetical protein
MFCYVKHNKARNTGVLIQDYLLIMHIRAASLNMMKHPGFSFQYKCVLKTRISIIQLPEFQQLHQVTTSSLLRMATKAVSILKYRMII